jgi:hypothetical protein
MSFLRKAITVARSDEKQRAMSLLCSIRRHRGLYPLLLEGVLQFINARNGDDKDVLQAAKDHDALARGEVLIFQGPTMRSTWQQKQLSRQSYLCSHVLLIGGPWKS